MLLHHNQIFFLVGTSYTHCHLNSSNQCLGSNGKLFPQDPIHVLNHPNNDMALCSSPDLVDWNLVNPSLIPADQRPNGIYFRPKLIWNELTSRFVIWFNYVTEGANCSEGWAANFSGHCHSTSARPSLRPSTARS